MRDETPATAPLTDDGGQGGSGSGHARALGDDSGANAARGLGARQARIQQLERELGIGDSLPPDTAKARLGMDEFILQSHGGSQ